MTTTRRAVVRGAAWSVPVVLVAAQAPAFAASPCASAGYESGWSFVVTSPSGSAFKTGTGSNGYSGPYYRSQQDNDSAAQEIYSNPAITITGSRNLILIAGRAYTFTFKINAKYASGGAANSQNQYLRIFLGPNMQRQFGPSQFSMVRV